MWNEHVSNNIDSAIMEKKVSIVICAYNEEETIEYVVRTCHKFNPKAEIMVVDDGSQDRTPEILASLESEIPIKVVKLEENRGKSFAMATGVEKAKHEIILFFDADVTGIREKHFRQLLDPMLINPPEADMVVGSPSETLINYRINPFRNLTGERTLFREDLLPILEDIRYIQFGVETYINLYFQSRGKSIKYTLLEGLSHPTKYKKTTSGAATREFVEEGRQIAETLLGNYDLILKSIGANIDEKGAAMKESYRKLQEEVNERIRILLGNNG